jgi:hypothetical protein
MDQSVWRFLLTCLLLVVLPLQGFAATSMLGCGPDHHQLDAAPAQTVELSTSFQYDHDDAVPLRQLIIQHTDGDSGSHQFSATDASADGHASHLNGKSKCSHCAPCCIGAALTTNLSLHLVVPVSRAVFPLLTHVPSSALVVGLDRPPRTLLV